METYYSIADKRAYIDDDFHKNVLEKLGKLPSDSDGAVRWCQLAKQIGEAWFNKYDHVQDGGYAFALFHDLITSAETDARKFFPDGWRN